jgi:hypothetical protein
MRASLASLAAVLLLCACAGPGPGVTGNDTGGIIPYANADPAAAREMARAHCAQYDKVPRATGVDRQYGGYYSFACMWDTRAAH